jgi:hypothetical protein
MCHNNHFTVSFTFMYWNKHMQTGKTEPYVITLTLHNKEINQFNDSSKFITR